MERSGKLHAVVIPVKAFGQAKERLAGVLRADQRRHLAQVLATRVVLAAAPLPVFVVCDDDEVATWATSLGATVAWTPALGLNAAVRTAVGSLATSGIDVVTVAHGDLAEPSTLGSLPVIDGVTLVPDTRRDGTNVIVVQTALPFEFGYGPGSFERHRRECARLGVAHLVVESILGRDVDVPSDLDQLDRSALGLG